jgi:hypothetical protein
VRVFHHVVEDGCDELVSILEPSVDETTGYVNRVIDVRDAPPTSDLSLVSERSELDRVE